jgi:hypothetical protein
MLKITSFAILVVAFGLFTSACFEEVSLDDHCPPTSSGCETYDFDGDGIPNGQDPDGDNDGVDNLDDDFPDDPSCATQDEANCAACGEGCALGETCVMGACSGAQDNTGEDSEEPWWGSDGPGTRDEAPPADEPGKPRPDTNDVQEEEEEEEPEERGPPEADAVDNSCIAENCDVSSCMAQTECAQAISCLEQCTSESCIMGCIDDAPSIYSDELGNAFDCGYQAGCFF